MINSAAADLKVPFGLPVGRLGGVIEEGAPGRMPTFIEDGIAGGQAYIKVWPDPAMAVGKALYVAGDHIPGWQRPCRLPPGPSPELYPQSPISLDRGRGPRSPPLGKGHYHSAAVLLLL